MVVYLTDDPRGHGWGKIELTHPHLFVDDSWRGAFRLALSLWLRRGIQVVAVFGYRGPVCVTAALCSRLLGRTLVTRSDSNLTRVLGEGRGKRLLRRLAVRAVLPRSTRVWTIGEANETYWRDYLGFPHCTRIPYEVPVLPNSMGAAPAARTTDPLAVRVLYVGRLDAVKRALDLVRAFRELPAAAWDWHLDIVGDGPNRLSVAAAATADPRIQMHGAVEYEELDTFYRKADILVLPSRHEPWGLVVNEAVGFGLWVVVSDQVGAKELITSPERGVVFPVGDIQRLGECLQRVGQFAERLPVPPRTNTAELMGRELRRLTQR